MFFDNLSSSILRICNENNFSYEFASEICDISDRYLGNIIRKKSAPTITVLEKLCKGFDRSPNELLGVVPANQELTFRFPMQVLEARHFRSREKLLFLAICPRCKCTLERQNQAYCDRCGQKLAWEKFEVSLPIIL